MWKAGHLSTQTLPSDSSACPYLKGGSLVQMLLMFHLKPGRVTTASVSPSSIVPACLPSRPHPFSGSWLGLWAIGIEHLRGHLPWVSAASYLDRCSWLHCKSVPGGLLVSCRSCLGLGTERRGVLPSGWSPLGTCAHDFSPDSVDSILDEAHASSPHAPLSPLWALATQEPWASGARPASPGRDLRISLSAG